MGPLKIVLSIVYGIVCLVLIVVVLRQEGKQAGLSSSISGAGESYWDKNKGRSEEGFLKLVTKIAAVAFILLSLLLNIF